MAWRRDGWAGTAVLMATVLMATLSLGCDACGSSRSKSGDVSMTPEQVKSVAEEAYMWGWPMANLLTRNHRVRLVPKPGHLMGIAPVAPIGRASMLADYIEPDQKFVACPNQDVVYGFGMMELDQSPVVIQVPDFGDRYWVYAIYDARTDQIAKIGQQHDTKPGHYLVVGPGWDGEPPDGIAGVFRSSTNLTVMIPRLFMNDTDEDRAAVQPLINQIAAYPVQEYDGEWAITEWRNAPRIPYLLGLIKRGPPVWVEPKKFLDQLAEILERVPPLPGEEPLYERFRELTAAAAEDRAIRRAAVSTFAAMQADVIDGFLKWSENGEPAGNGWHRSIDSAAWGTGYRNRTASARSNIFENVQEETRYYYTDDDAEGTALDGKLGYAITFEAGALPPVRGFWSMTLYSASHFFHENPLDRYSLGTKNSTLQYNADGSLTIYAGATSPGADLESNWLPAPDGPFSLYIRAYWGEAPILDGSWVPPKIVRR
ncbi:MAG: DUF1254 domain-containing protein [Myxococcota bacterium]